MSGRLSCATFVVTLLGVIAAWLVVPGISDRLPWSKKGEASEAPTAVTTTDNAAPITRTTHKRRPISLAVGSYVVTLTSCRRGYDKKVMCRGLIGNDTDDYKSVRVYTNNAKGQFATLVDSAGVPRRSSHCWLAQDDGNWWAGDTIVPRARYAFAYEFSLPIVVTRAQVVEIYFSDDAPAWRYDQIRRIRFENVPILPPPERSWWWSQ